MSEASERDPGDGPDEDLTDEEREQMAQEGRLQQTEQEEEEEQ